MCVEQKSTLLGWEGQTFGQMQWVCRRPTSLAPYRSSIWGPRDTPSHFVPMLLWHVSHRGQPGDSCVPSKARKTWGDQSSCNGDIPAACGTPTCTPTLERSTWPRVSHTLHPQPGELLSQREPQRRLQTPNVSCWAQLKSVTGHRVKETQ